VLKRSNHLATPKTVARRSERPSGEEKRTKKAE
jgi:hypothetical protein